MENFRILQEIECLFKKRPNVINNTKVISVCLHVCTLNLKPVHLTKTVFNIKFKKVSGFKDFLQQEFHFCNLDQQVKEYMLIGVFQHKTLVNKIIIQRILSLVYNIVHIAIYFECRGISCSLPNKKLNVHALFFQNEKIFI